VILQKTLLHTLSRTQSELACCADRKTALCDLLVAYVAEQSNTAPLIYRDPESEDLPPAVPICCSKTENLRIVKQRVFADT